MSPLPSRVNASHHEAEVPNGAGLATGFADLLLVHLLNDDPVATAKGMGRSGKRQRQKKYQGESESIE